MSKCPFNVNDAVGIMTDEIYLFEEDHEYMYTISDIPILFTTIIQQISTNFEGIDVNSDDFKEFIELTRDEMINAYLNAQDVDLSNYEWFNESACLRDAANILQGGATSSSLVPHSSEALVYQREGRSRKDVSDAFLFTSYGTAETVKQKAILEIKTNIVDACFIDRSGKYRTPSNKAELNRNIRTYQQELLDRILDYLSTLSSIPSDVKEVIDDPTWYKDGTSTYAWEKIFSFAKSKLNPEIFTSSVLNDIYLASISNLGTDKQIQAKKQLDAYNAFVMLSNFDSFLVWLFKDSININRFGAKDGTDKYSFDKKTGNQIKSYRKDENIFIEDEADKITKLLIETTQMLNEDGNPIDGKFLTFQDFAYITSMLKLWITDENVQKVVFDDTLCTKLESEGISAETLSVLQYNSLSGLIASLRLNYQKIMPALAEFFSNTKYLEKLNLKVYTELSKDVKNKFITVCTQLFHANKSSSIYNLSNPLGEFNIFRNLCQTSDSIYRNVFTQAYQDNDGSFYNRMLSDLAVYKIRLGIQNTINNINSPALQLDFKEKMRTLYNFDEKQTTRTNGINTNTYTIRSYTIPKTNITISVETGLATEDVTLTLQINGQTYNLNKAAEMEVALEQDKHLKKQILQFCDELLSTNFVSDISYFDNYVLKRGGSEFTNLAGLLQYAGRVLNRKYISTVVLANKTTSEKRTIISNTFGGELAEKIGYDLVRDQINLHGGQQNIDIVLSLAQAKLESMGLTTSAQVNNSEGKAQSNQALSKLLGSYGSQWYLQEKQPWSVTYDMDILNVSGLFKGVQVINEVYSKKLNKNKKAVAMTPAEFSVTGIVLDFLPALFEKSSNRITTNGLAQFIASVNSDKGTVDKLVIDLFKQMIDKETGNKYNYATATMSQIYKDISRNLGKYYSRMLDNIIDSYDRLFKHVETYLQDNNLGLEDFEILEMLNGFDYLKDFTAFRSFISALNSDNGTNFSEEKFINELVKSYKEHYPQDQIELVSMIHTNFIKNNIGVEELRPSNTLLGQIYRFGYQGSKFDEFKDEVTGKTEKYDLVSLLLDEKAKRDGQWSTLQQFFEMRQLELIGSYIDNGSRLNIINSPVFEDIEKEKNYQSWINKRGDLIFATVDGIEIASKQDFISHFGDIDIVDFFQNRCNTKSVVINPILERQNALQYLFSQQWMVTTVGSFIAHPFKENAVGAAVALRKKFPWVQEMYEESAQFIAQSKRNVSFTAQMQQFQLNDVYGINDTYTIAVVKDLVKFAPILTRRKNKIKSWDGATLADPFTVHLENNSLAGNSSGLTKKTFVHFKNETVGNGGIIKTAVFGLTNDNMKSSPNSLLNLFYKMSNKKWEDEFGHKIVWDLTEDNLIKSSIGTDDSIKIEQPELYFSKGGHFYQILNIENIEGTNDYNRTIVEVDIKGQPLVNAQPQTKLIKNVNSNYQAWKLFGGLYSMESDGQQLVPSENSIKAVVNCMNHKGIMRSSSSSIRTQDDFYQPMKHSQIQYIVTEGAIKQGAANMNENLVFDDDSALLTQTIRMFQAGTQLDKEHHADLADVSLPTQIVTACAALGYTFNSANNLYKGISAIASIALDQILEQAHIAFTNQDKVGLLSKCTHIIIDNLATATTQNFGTFLAQSILESAKAAQEDNFNWSNQGLPISDNTVFNRAINALSNYMTKNAIKLKMPGSLAIMTPSHKMVPIYGDRKFGDYLDPFREILISQKEHYDTKPIYKDGIGKVSKIQIGHKYKILRKNPIRAVLDSNGTWKVTLDGINSFTWTVDELNKLKGVSIFADKDGNPQKTSTAVSQDVYHDLAIFATIRNETFKRRKRTRLEEKPESDTEQDPYILRINSEAWEEFLQVKDAGFGGQVEYKTATLENTTDDEINYYELRDLVKSGDVFSIHEYILDGRDLGSYTVTFDGILKVDNSEYEDQLLESAKAEYIRKYLESSLDKNYISKHWRDYEDTLSLEDLIFKEIAFYDAERQDKIRWDTIAKELYRITDSSKPRTKSEEQSALKWLSNKTSGIAFNKFIHNIYENLKGNRFPNLSDSDVKNAAIDILMGFSGTQSQWKNAFYTRIANKILSQNSDYIQQLQDLQQVPARELLPKEKIDEIHEYILNNSTSEEDSFNIWDLQSVQDLHNSKEGTDEYKLADARMKRDIYVLSKSGIDLEKKWQELMDKLISKKYEIKDVINEAKLIFGKALVDRITGDTVVKKILWGRVHPNSYEVSSKGDDRFSALKATFGKDTIIDGINVSGRTIEDVYQNVIKKSGKGQAPSSGSKLYLAPTIRDGQPLVFNMDYSYGNEKTSNVKANTTLEAIKLGERTATTRYEKDGYIDRWKKVKVGDIIEFKDKRGNKVLVRVTKELTKLDKNTSAQEWSDKEGWNVNRFNKKVKPEIDKGEAYQIEFEYIDTSSKEGIENYSYKYGYLPLWREWARQYPELIKDLREKAAGKVLTDQFANTRVSQARALADILNESSEQDILSNNLLIELGKLFTNTVQVSNNREVRVNKDSIEHEDYEVVMPKIYKTTYGLEDNVCLAKIANDKNYFVKQALRKREPLISDTLYNIELKDINGKHKYIAFDGFVDIPQGYRDVTDEVPQILNEDGTKYRVDEETEDELYQLKEGIKIFQDSLGHEIIILTPATDAEGNNIDILDNLEYILKAISGMSINLTNNNLNLSLEQQKNLLDVLKNSIWDDFIEDNLNSPKTIEDYLEQQQTIKADYTEDDLNNLDKLIASLEKYDKKSQEYKDISNKINKITRSVEFINGREKHNSFIESLKIIAARIPAQNMQSFMGMKVVGFSNGDRNTAYVSDLQIFLQGSDFDIDSVTLLSYDLNEQGKLEFWSPFASLRDTESIEQSKKIPFPTGKEVEENTTSIDSENVVQATEYFTKFLDLFRFGLTKNGEVTIKLQIPRKSRKSKYLIPLFSELFKQEIIYDTQKGVPQDIIDKVSEKISKIINANFTANDNVITYLSDELVKIIDRHNTYLSHNKRMTDQRRRRIINNSNLSSMYEIIIDPVNLSQSMTSVDTVTDPVKKLALTSAKTSRQSYMGAGNVNNHGEMISTNYTGKDCIAKSASSMKAYFKLTHYYNTILNSKDKRQQALVTINPEIFNRCGKYRPILANIRAVDPSTIVDPTLIEQLLESQTAEDMAGNLSALLGLAADNAKELILRKINAGIDMIGLYLYGISIGYTIPQLSEIMMSESVDVLQEAMQSDFITGYQGDNNYKIFDYFKFGPQKELKRYDIKPKGAKKSKENELKGWKISQNVVYAILQWMKETDPNLVNSYSANTDKRYLSIVSEKINNNEVPSNFELSRAIGDFANLFCDYTEDGAVNINSISEYSNHFEDAIKYIEDFLFNQVNYDDPKGKYLLMDCVEFVKQYSMQRMKLYNENNYEKTNSIFVLSTGSQSMQTIGQIASLNQGLPSNLKDLIKKVNLIEKYVQEQFKIYYRLVYGKPIDDNEQTNKILEDLKINLTSFIHDSGYRQQQILNADAYKVNFNLFHVIDTLPDIKQYVNALGLIDQFFKDASVRYKFIRENFDDYSKTFRLKSDTLTEAMSRYMQSVFIQEYLKDVSAQGFQFPLIEGSRKFIGGRLSNETQETTTMQNLSSVEGIAYFKYWMENRVIPELKDRQVQFLKDLQGASRNNTVSGNELIAYTLPINMMPSKEGSNEDLIFKEYLNSFNSMNEVYSYTNPVTNQTYNWDVKELMFYYALTAFEWKPSQNSLMQMFKMALSKKDKFDKVNDFFRKIQELEQSDLSTILLNYPIKYFMGARNRFSDPNAEYVWNFNQLTGKKELYKKKKEEKKYSYDEENPDYEGEDTYDEYYEDYLDEEDYGDSNTGLPGYEFEDSPDANYFMFGGEGSKSAKSIQLKDTVNEDEKLFNTEDDVKSAITNWLAHLGVNLSKEAITELMPLLTERRINPITNDEGFVLKFSEFNNYINKNDPEQCNVPF